jgi:hypothetical protein
LAELELCQTEPSSQKFESPISDFSLSTSWKRATTPISNQSRGVEGTIAWRGVEGGDMFCFRKLILSNLLQRFLKRFSFLFGIWGTVGQLLIIYFKLSLRKH